MTASTRLHSTEENNDLKTILLKFTRQWYLFAISLSLALAGAFIFNKISSPVFRVSTKVMIKADDPRTRQRATQSDEQYFQGIAMFMGSKNIYNELQNLRSSPLIREAISTLNIEVSYYSIEKMVRKELYKSSPIVVVFDRLHSQTVGVEYKLNFDEKGNFSIHAKGEQVKVYSYNEQKELFVRPKFSMEGNYALGQSIISDFYSFKILLSNDYERENLRGKKFIVKFHALDDLTAEFRDALVVASTNEYATIADISMEVSNVHKGIDFLNALTNRYVHKSLEQKNHIAVNTIEYIDGQISQIADSLSRAERRLQDFRTRHQVLDITSKAGRSYEQLQELERQKDIIDAQYKYYVYINDYFEKNKDISDLIAPSSMGIEDPLLNNLIQELTRLNAEKSSLVDNKQEKSPYVKTLTVKIDNLKKTIEENIKYVLNTTKISLDDINQRISSINREISSLPGTERELVGIERKFNLNDAIYTFLLEKRAEAQIARASNLPDSEITEPAKMVGRTPIYPKTKVNYIFAFILGLFVPIGWILGREIWHDEVSDLREIEKITPYSILGTILHNDTPVLRPLIEFPKSGVAESFRSIRTNLQYYMRGTDSQVVMLTSSLSQEGKSFVSLNLAVSLAISNKRTVLLGFDLRRPKISEYMNITEMLGITSYLINTATLSDIIVRTDLENLDYIPAGTVPPNPVELIASDKVQTLITQLREMYDYIIIDTPPLGLVTDANLLMNYSDVNIFVVRLGYTPRKIFPKVIREVEAKGIKNMTILANDYKIESRNYGYYYGYYKKHPATKRRKTGSNA